MLSKSFLDKIRIHASKAIVLTCLVKFNVQGCLQIKCTNDMNKLICGNTISQGNGELMCFFASHLFFTI